MAGTLNKGSLVKGTGGSGGGGDGKFPTIVTDSGSSLPVDLSGYELNDIFLNTTDKKIYKTMADSYEFNDVYTAYDNTLISSSSQYHDLSVNLQTGVVGNFKRIGQYQNNCIYKFSDDYGIFSGDKIYHIHFKITSTPTTDTRYGLFYAMIGSQGNWTYSTGFYIKNNKIYAIQSRSQMGTVEVGTAETLVLNYEIQENKDYYLEVHKLSNGNCTATLSETNYNINSIAENTFALGDYIGNGTARFYYGKTIGTTSEENNGGVFTIGEIYLLDSSGEFLKASSELNWDNGTDITDKTEYADKTNGALYLYENSELVKIGGSSTKKVYTISADNTSTLNVSSDFTKIVDVLKNGVELALTDDYTISSGVITFVTALSTTDKITVKGE